MVKIVEDANIPGLGKIVHTECTHEVQLTEAEEQLEEQRRSELFFENWEEYQKVERERCFCKECSYLDEKLEALHSAGAVILSASQLVEAITKSVSISDVSIEYDGLKWQGYDSGRLSNVIHDPRDKKVLCKCVYDPRNYCRLLKESLLHLGKNGTYVREGALCVPAEEPKIYLLRNSFLLDCKKDNGHLDQDFDVMRYIAALDPNFYFQLNDFRPIEFKAFDSDPRTKWLFEDSAKEYGELLDKFEQKMITCDEAFLERELNSELKEKLNYESLRFSIDPLIGSWEDNKEQRNALDYLRESFQKNETAPFLIHLYLRDLSRPGLNDPLTTPSIDSKIGFIRGLIPEK